MTDTPRTLEELQALYADNASGDISPQDLRDGFASIATPVYTGGLDARETFWYATSMALEVPDNTYVFPSLSAHTAENDPFALRVDDDYVSTYWAGTLPGYFALDSGKWDLYVYARWAEATPATGQFWGSFDYVEDPLVGPGSDDPQTAASGSNFGRSYVELASLGVVQSVYLQPAIRIAPDHDARLVPYFWQDSGDTLTVQDASFYIREAR